MSQTHWNSSSPKKKFLSGMPVLALLLSASGAFAAAPNVVVDAQLTAQTGLNAPQSIAVAPNGTYYVADAGNNRIQAYTGSTSSTVNTGPISNPQAVAVDSLGDLFIGDSPSSGVGRVIEVHATNGVLNGSVTTLVQGGALKDVTALTVDTNPSSATFNTVYIGDDVSFALYSVAAGSSNLVPLGITGLPTNILPTAIAKDAAGNLYVADFFSTVYKIPAGSTVAAIYIVPNFTVFSPTGLAIDPKGNLYILTLTATSATPSQAVPQNIIEIPGGDVDSAFRVPVTGLVNGAGIAIDQSGHVYVADFNNNNVVELIYGAPVGLSQVAVHAVGTPVTFNYEVNATETLRGFRFISQGDISTEVQAASGNCTNATYTVGSDGGSISPSDPFVCQASFAAAPAYPGLRYGAVQLRGAGTTILASTEVFSTGIAGAGVVYPLTETTAATNINAPIGLVVSGLDRKLYIVDNSGTPQILSANGPNGKTLTKVDTSPITLGAPIGITINGQGDLYVADVGGNTAIGQIVVVPTRTGQTPFAFNPGNLLVHPISVAFDSAGNLFIGDVGTGNTNNTDPNNPGFIVEVPVGGGPAFKVNTGTVQVYYPGGLAADPYTGDLLVADAGYLTGATGTTAASKVIRIPAGGGSAIDIPQFDGTNPTAIVFDPAETYYVLDGTTNKITVVSLVSSTYTMPLNGNLINSPSTFAITNGGQSFVVANYAGFGTAVMNNLIYLNGKTSTLNFGPVSVGQQSSTLNAVLNSIGSAFLNFNTPYFTSTGNTGDFNFLSDTSCIDDLELQPGTVCNLYLQFVPQATGLRTSTVTFQTDDYLPNVPVLNLRGRGR
jgi:sugar lactone lactonase YvrE